MTKYDFHAALNPADSDEQTLGCRHNNPDICRNNLLQDVCAFVRDDGICKLPPMSWAKQYKMLLEKYGKTTDE